MKSERKIVRNFCDSKKIKYYESELLPFIEVSVDMIILRLSKQMETERMIKILESVF